MTTVTVYGPFQPKMSCETWYEAAPQILVCVGHTHCARDITVDDIRIVNLGSVSNPYPPDLRASYVVLEADSTGYRLAHHQADYDHAAVIAECERVKHPSTGFITRYMLGQHKPPWM